MTVRLLLPDAARQKLRDEAARLLRLYRDIEIRIPELNRFVAKLKREYPQAFRGQ